MSQPKTTATTASKRLKRKSEQFYSEEIARKQGCAASSFEVPSPSLPSPSVEAINSDWNGTKCELAFYDRPCEQLARDLLGCTLLRACSSSDLCCGRIVETEAYLGGADRAAHSYDGKRTDRNEAMYMPPGTAYVYSIYGIHHCFNISSRGEGAAVLIRAIEPLGDATSMMERRGNAKRVRDLCNGPAKLCQALDVDKKCNKVNMVSSEALWVESPAQREEFEIVASGRIGVQYAGEEWGNKKLRFYIKGSPFISKK